jgi:hypothetical protein
LESLAWRLITPPNGGGAGGKNFDSGDTVAAGEQASDEGCCANAPLAVMPASEMAVSAMRRISEVYKFLILPLLLNASYRSFISIYSSGCRLTRSSKTCCWSRISPAH